MSDLHGRQRLDDIPPILRWSLIAIKEVGFPIVVVVYLGYIQLTAFPKMINSLEANTRAMEILSDSVTKHSHQTERAFRRMLGNRFPDD